MSERKRGAAASIDIDGLLQDTWLQVISLHHGPQFQDGEGRVLWERCVADVERVQRELKASELDETSCRHIMTAQCALLDEAVKGRGVEDDACVQWYDIPLQGHFLGTMDAGDTLCDRMRDVLREPAPDHAVVTCFQRIMMLGFPDFVLPLLPEGRGLTPRERTWRCVLGIFTLAAIAALLSSGWNNRQLLQRVSFDIARYDRIPMHDFGSKADAVAVLRDDAAELDDQARNGVPARMGLGLYQGERLRMPVLDAIRSYVPPPPPPEPQPKPKPVPKIVRLDSMSLFDSGKFVLKAGSTKWLVNSLVGIKAKPGWLIVVSGHTDNTGNPKLNQTLSLKRAEAVRDWMRDTGDVPESCFAVQGYGESRPIATNDTPEGRALNRRVEISLVPQASACQIPGTYPATFEPGGTDSISQSLLGLVGLGIPGTAEHIATPVSRFLSLLGVLQQPGKTQEGMQALVSLLAPDTTAQVSPYCLRPVEVSQPLGFYGDDDFLLEGNTPLGDEAMDASSQLLIALTTDNEQESQGWKPDGLLYQDFLVLLRVYLGWRFKARITLTTRTRLLAAPPLGDGPFWLGMNGVLGAEDEDLPDDIPQTFTTELGYYTGLQPATPQQGNRRVTYKFN